MKNKKPIFLASCLLPFILLGCKTESKPVRVAVASSLYSELSAKLINEISKKEVELISGGSLKFSTQILNGAPFDIFISADLESVSRIKKNSSFKKIPDPQKYGQGFLMRCDWQNEKESCPERVVIASPKLAPYGKLALNFLENKNCPSEKIEAPNAIGALQIFNLKEVNSVLTSASLKSKTKARCVELRGYHTEYYIQLLNEK